MSKINETKVYKQDSATVVELEGNHGVTGVKVRFASAYYGTITIKYAQNGILTDLISFAEQEVNGDLEIEIGAETPVSASHIFVFSDADIEIRDVCVYEQENSDAECLRNLPWTVKNSPCRRVNVPSIM